jgi:phosphoglycerol transferase MdoB-like AlkP superfamily enzyme
MTNKREQISNFLQLKCYCRSKNNPTETAVYFFFRWKIHRKVVRALPENPIKKIMNLVLIFFFLFLLFHSIHSNKQFISLYYLLFFSRIFFSSFHHLILVLYSLEPTNKRSFFPHFIIDFSLSGETEQKVKLSRVAHV